MKRGLLLLLGILSFASVKANDYTTSAKKSIINNRNDEAVTFVEKGIQFHVFLDGEFEFNSLTRNSNYYNYNGRTYSNNSLRVDRDYRGRIKRIGRNYIRYDYRGNVSKIGNVKLYYRNGLLRRVGNLKISYNNWGEPYFYGNVNRSSNYDSDFHFSINIGPIFSYNDRFFYNRSFKNNYKKYREDKDYYYYKANSNAKVGKRNKIIKRRKSNATTRKSTIKTKRKIVPKATKRVKKGTTKKKGNKVYEKRRS
ncbi:hypothetical protein KCTC32516_00032 [Polaribacter huanghezhanensis]|uniref:hypothetical protein n=1 Tax=Polaribacter huanghezhanensis TaxID=1354726 RepID=UPI0026490F38|nr:hypothetical protein [Polaribacter huanghezhanensis]WKD84698.1 hypothetical protein KCTC32516_00032 [Polaribacter huanghezhanensis]